GVGPDILVGVFLERSPDLVAAIIGILKAGGAYVPIDPAHPNERIRYILDEFRIGIVVTQESLVDELQSISGESICLDDDGAAIAELLRSGAVPTSVRTVNLAGESLSGKLVEQLYATTRVEKFYNLYGPTETTTYSTYTLVPRGAQVTVGRPITGTRCYILDAY